MPFSTFEAGKKYTLPAIAITREEILSFAEKYDPSPPHIDEEYAQGTSYGVLRAPGVLCLMLVWNQFMRAGFFAGGQLSGTYMNIEWLSLVLEGDVLRGEVSVVPKAQREGSGFVEITLEAYNQNGTHVMHAVTQALASK